MSLPPGFRFHPTDEELVSYYLKRKIDGQKIELEVIPVVELYKFNPWDLPGMFCFSLSLKFSVFMTAVTFQFQDEIVEVTQPSCFADKSFLPNRDMEWFFFCPRDRKYPNGSRTNRATAVGYWKATGKDRKVVCSNSVIGLRKTLVFYCGRAPLGDRTNWVMHEYRICEEGSSEVRGAFVLCRVVKKNENGLKTGDFQGESRSRRTMPCSLNDINQGNFSGSASRITGETPSPENNLVNGSTGSNPIASPSEDRRRSERCKAIMETDLSNYSVSTDPVSIIQKVCASECTSEVNSPTSATAFQPCNLMTSPFPAYLTEEIDLANDLSRLGFLSTYPRHTNSLGMDADMMFQSFEWPAYPGNMNSLTDGLRHSTAKKSRSLIRPNMKDHAAKPFNIEQLEQEPSDASKFCRDIVDLTQPHFKIVVKLSNRTLPNWSRKMRSKENKEKKHPLLSVGA
ncbi:hypothetical protein ACLOJK_034009 [Asimina triloba]